MMRQDPSFSDFVKTNFNDPFAFMYKDIRLDDNTNLVLLVLENLAVVQDVMYVDAPKEETLTRKDYIDWAREKTNRWQEVLPFADVLNSLLQRCTTLILNENVDASASQDYYDTFHAFSDVFYTITSRPAKVFESAFKTRDVAMAGNLACLAHKTLYTLAFAQISRPDLLMAQNKFSDAFHGVYANMFDQRPVLHAIERSQGIDLYGSWRRSDSESNEYDAYVDWLGKSGWYERLPVEQSEALQELQGRCERIREASTDPELFSELEDKLSSGEPWVKVETESLYSNDNMFSELFQSLAREDGLSDTGFKEAFRVAPQQGDDGDTYDYVEVFRKGFAAHKVLFTLAVAEYLSSRAPQAADGAAAAATFYPFAAAPSTEDAFAREVEAAALQPLPSSGESTPRKTPRPIAASSTTADEAFDDDLERAGLSQQVSDVVRALRTEGTFYEFLSVPKSLSSTDILIGARSGASERKRVTLHVDPNSKKQNVDAHVNPPRVTRHSSLWHPRSYQPDPVEKLPTSLNEDVTLDVIGGIAKQTTGTRQSIDIHVHKTSPDVSLGITFKRDLRDEKLRVARLNPKVPTVQIIDEVKLGSIAAQSDLRPGDIVRSINGSSVYSKLEAARTLREAVGDVLLSIQRPVDQ